ncbi:tRNA dihydrouridine synthase DusB [Anaerotruncus rubiinfantis]|uniref:tRNA dihydrouridine synthase DusB n=1 Tax=Anaerotruncus rubiinfantis TaxID=1720200 RepID=UPI0018970F5D|nr:tRNA dihydrouridine synthase DusB [Anaerotruncus rubiinfantis]
MKIGNLEIKRTAALAPMAGVADSAFRRICKQFGAAYLVGEMASAKGMHYSDRKTAELLGVSDEERPVAVQLFGDDPELIAEAAKKALDYRPDVIDLNMGCPAPKIAGNGGGSALMKNPTLAGKITEAAVKAVDLPVTVKFRKGWDNEHVNAVEFGRIMQESGAAALTVHGRTREQFYAPPVDLDIIAAVKAAVSIPVIGNGDCDSIQSVINMYDYTKCDLVMIGRGALGNPWIFRQVDQFLADGTVLPLPPLEERMAVMLRQFSLACEQKGEYGAMREARKHAAWYMKGVRGAASLRRQAGTLCTLADARALAEEALRLNPEEAVLDKPSNEEEER